eukprot:816717_1
MGMTPSNPQFDAVNYVLDYSINLLHPDQYGMIMERLGPNVNNFPAQGKNQVLSDFNECLSTANPQLVSEYHRLRQVMWGAVALFIIGFILFFVFMSAFTQGISIGIFLLIALWIGGIVAFCVIGTKQRALAQQWRNDILSKLQQKMAIWKAMYPSFTFTIIYPVEVWRRRGSRGNRRRRLVAIWAYVRVTQGPCQTGYNEPVFATTTNQISAAPIQQQVVMQPQPQMVNVNGQMVQGTPAIINGQQVIVVQQPPQQVQQQQVIYQQPIQQQQVIYQQPIQQQQPPQYATTVNGYPG